MIQTARVVVYYRATTFAMLVRVHLGLRAAVHHTDSTDLYHTSSAAVRQPQRPNLAVLVRVHVGMRAAVYHTASAAVYNTASARVHHIAIQPPCCVRVSRVSCIFVSQCLCGTIVHR